MKNYSVFGKIFWTPAVGNENTTILDNQKLQILKSLRIRNIQSKHYRINF